MSGARPPEAGSHRSRQAEASPVSGARPPEAGSHRSRQAEGSPVIGATVAALHRRTGGRLPGLAAAAALALAATWIAAGLGDPLARNPVLVAMLLGLGLGCTFG